jgi:uncharacterized protein (DUF2252 family)
LTDFDDSARGPYVIDLVRFGVSLELAALIKNAGRLKTGIGSALDEKYLLRVEGWTEREDDD